MAADPFNFIHSYYDLGREFYSTHSPKHYPNPSLVYFNHDLAENLNLNMRDWNNNNLADFFSGSQLSQSCRPLAMAYAGHQFGHFVAQLGDGRALLLGEQLTNDGLLFDIQLKGSGRTNYSRGGDGLAPLGAMIREVLISENLHYLGIPTTRSLAVVSSGEAVQREAILPGGVLTRVAASHIRIGTFEYFYARKDLKNLKILLDYSLKRHDADLTCDQDGYLLFFKRVCQRQVSLISQWMGFGFIHGVMNTDNCSLSGESIDFGPCAFMDHFRFDQVFSSIDRHGRYAYDQQASILFWNLTCLARCLLPFLDENEQKAIALAEACLADCEILYKNQFRHVFAKKIGLFSPDSKDDSLIMNILNYLQDSELDFTLFFHSLPKKITQKKSIYEQLLQRLQQQKESLTMALDLMNMNNPLCIARNHLVEKAIQDADQGDFKFFLDFLDVLKTPYQKPVQHLRFTKAPQEEEKVRQTFCGT